MFRPRANSVSRRHAFSRNLAFLSGVPKREPFKMKYKYYQTWFGTSRSTESCLSHFCLLLCLCVCVCLKRDAAIERLVPGAQLCAFVCGWVMQWNPSYHRIAPTLMLSLMCGPCPGNGPIWSCMGMRAGPICFMQGTTAQASSPRSSGANSNSDGFRLVSCCGLLTDVRVELYISYQSSKPFGLIQSDLYLIPFYMDQTIF